MALSLAPRSLPNDLAKLSIVRVFVDDILRAAAPADLLLAMMEAVGRKAQAAGLTVTDVDAELAAWNAERR